MLYVPAMLRTRRLLWNYIASCHTRHNIIVKTLIKIVSLLILSIYWTIHQYCPHRYNNIVQWCVIDNKIDRVWGPLPLAKVMHRGHILVFFVCVCDISFLLCLNFNPNINFHLKLARPQNGIPHLCPEGLIFYHCISSQTDVYVYSLKCNFTDL